PHSASHYPDRRVFGLVLVLLLAPRPTLFPYTTLFRSPSRGNIAPDLFVPMAEETGHIRVLTEWVLERAIADQKAHVRAPIRSTRDRKSTRLNSSHVKISYAVFCLKKKKENTQICGQVW